MPGLIVERPRWIAGAAVATAALALVIFAVRSGGSHQRAAQLRSAPAAPAAVAEPAAPEPQAAEAEADADEPTVPTATVPCFDDRTELLADGGQPVLCWGENCLSDLDDPAAIVPRPAPQARSREAVVSADQVCSGKRCDRLGPRLREAVAGVDPSELSATRDHAIVVVRGDKGYVEAYNRATDSPIELGLPRRDEGEVESMDVLGDKLIVARSCNEFCSAIARIVDTTGAASGDSFSLMPSSERGGLVELDRDHAVAFGRFGELTLIAGGRVAASASLLPERARQPQEAVAQAVRIDDRTLVAAWCTAGRRGRACHVTRIQVEDPEDGNGGQTLTLDSDHVLPRCVAED
jgi:hypothetical protein